MLAIEAKLARCRELALKASCEFTRTHLKQLAADLQSELNRLHNAARRLGYQG